MRVLWADDQISVAHSCGALLDQTRYDVVFVSDGEEALLRLRQEAFDVVIADLMMPPGEWGGLWLLERIRDLEIPTPAVVLSGEGTQVETIRAIRLGARDYIMKERMESELVERIERAVISDARKLIDGGESHTVEFKSSARWDVKQSKASKEMEFVILRAVAGFLKSESGGNLFIGVQDDGVVLGLREDFKTLPRQNRDGFENWLVSRLSDAFGNHIGSLLRISFLEIYNKDVCHISVRPSPAPIYLSEKGADQFYFRSGNTSRLLSAREAVEYCKQRWR
jgi:DNA-binding NarL/FixJ family response regulator